MMQSTANSNAINRHHLSIQPQLTLTNLFLL